MNDYNDYRGAYQSKERANVYEKGIYVKGKESQISKLVFDAIYNLRRILIEHKVKTLNLIDFVDEDERHQNLEAVVNYTNLKMRLADRLKKVV